MALRLVGAVGFLSGCRATSTHPLPTTLYSNDPDQQMEFWHTLPTRHIVDNDEAFHALLLFFDGTDPNENYSQYAWRRCTNAKWFLMISIAPANESISRGVLAVALCRELKIRGGLTMMIIGPHQRYATRELQYMNLYPPSSPQQTFSGAQFIGIISRAEDYQRQQEGVEANKPHQEKALKDSTAQ